MVKQDLCATRLILSKSNTSGGQYAVVHYVGGRGYLFSFVLQMIWEMKTDRMRMKANKLRLKKLSPWV